MIRVIISKRTFSGMKPEIFHWMYTLLRRRVLGRGEERIAVLDCLCPPPCPSLEASTSPWPLLVKASAASKWLPCHLLFPRRPTLPAPGDASASASRSRTPLGAGEASLGGPCRSCKGIPSAGTMLGSCGSGSP